MSHAGKIDDDETKKFSCKEIQKISNVMKSYSVSSVHPIFDTDAHFCTRITITYPPVFTTANIRHMLRITKADKLYVKLSRRYPTRSDSHITGMVLYDDDYKGTKLDIDVYADSLTITSILGGLPLEESED